MKAGFVVAVAMAVGGVALANAQGSMVHVWVDDGIAREGGSVVFNVFLSQAPTEVVHVFWTTESLTASAGDDFPAISGVLVFTPERDGPTEIEIPVIQDGIEEGSETFLLLLTRATGAEILDPLVHGVIRDTSRAPPRCDPTGDGHSDVLVQLDEDTDPNPHGGPHDIWSPQSTVIRKMGVLRPSRWLIEAAADFDGDGACDYLWSPGHEARSCSEEPPAADDLVITDAMAVPEDCRDQRQRKRPAPSWQVTGAADTDLDGVADVLWWDPGEQRMFLWRDMVRGAVDPPLTPVLGCSGPPAGLAIFSADPLPDLLEYTGAGGLRAWTMAWGQVGYECRHPHLLWSGTPGTLAAAGDFDADGSDDLLWLSAVDPNDGSSRLSVHFIRDRAVRASSTFQWNNIDVSEAGMTGRRFAGPR